MPITRHAAALLTILALGACASEPEPAASNDAGKHGTQEAAPVPVVKVKGVPDATPEQQAEYDAFATLGYKLAWRASPLVGRRRHTLFFDSFGDSLVFQDSGNVVSLIEAATGAVRWSTEVDNPSERFVGNTLVGERLYSASDNELFVLDVKTGNLLERHHLAVVVNTAPVIAGNIAIFGSPTGEVLGHNLSSTYKQWGYKLRGVITAKPALIQGFFGSPAVGVVSQGGEILLADARTGASFGHAQIFAGLANNPVASDTRLFVASTDQSIYAFDLQGGRRHWRERTESPITDQPTLVGDSLYVAVPGRGLQRFDETTGAVTWTAKDVRGTVIATRGGRLIAWDAATQTASAIDPAHGDVVDRVTLAGVKRLVAEKFDDGALYAVTDQGRVSKFGPR